MTTKGKPRGRPFQKGQSGNPRGRPKEIAQIRELARKQTDEAITTLANICKDKKAPPSARVAAANSLLDRGYGKPTQYIEEGGNPIDALTEAEERALLEALDAIASSEGAAEEGADQTVH